MNEVGNYGLSILADRYAVAMMQLADKSELLHAIKTDLSMIKDIINSNSELRSFIEHPLIKNEDKKEILEKIFEQSIATQSMNLIRLLSDNNRLIILPFISEHYNKLLCKKRNIDIAEVITAVPIDENTVNRVKEKLEILFSQQINIETYIDKSIIAGMIVKVKDKIIDGSIRTKFENMKKQLIQS